jgi:hypothetical protein
MKLVGEEEQVLRALALRAKVRERPFMTVKELRYMIGKQSADVRLRLMRAHIDAHLPRWSKRFCAERALALAMVRNGRFGSLVPAMDLDLKRDQFGRLHSCVARYRVDLGGKRPVWVYMLAIDDGTLKRALA